MSTRRYRQRSWASVFLGKTKSGKRPDTEESWGKDAKVAPTSRRAVFFGVVLAVVGVGLLVFFYQVMSNNSGNPVADRPAVGQDQALEQQIEGAEELALAFLSETDPRQRLRWVRNVDQVREHMGQWPETVLRGTGKIERMLGHSDTGNCRMTCFVVNLPDGDVRLLEVVDTGDGPQVDWDAYARHCSADWPAIIDGRVDRADVRVSVSPGDYHKQPFADENEWTCFQFTSPDLPHRVHAYARKGTVREQRMKAIILGTTKFRQHMTLRISRKEGLNDEPLFEIERALAVGWVRGDADVEEEWQARE